MTKSVFHRMYTLIGKVASCTNYTYFFFFVVNRPVTQLVIAFDCQTQSLAVLAYCMLSSCIFVCVS